MNIIEAIKSKRPFYRRSWSDKEPITWYEVGTLEYEALIADDWEVQATITSSQFDSAWDRASYGARVTVSQHDEELFNRQYIDALYASLKRELKL